MVIWVCVISDYDYSTIRILNTSDMNASVSNSLAARIANIVILPANCHVCLEVATTTNVSTMILANVQNSLKKNAQTDITTKMITAVMSMFISLPSFH